MYFYVYMFGSGHYCVIWSDLSMVGSFYNEYIATSRFL